MRINLKVDPIDLAYAAGLLDGEGCFTVSNDKYCKPMIFCETTHRPTILWLQSMFGGAVSQPIKGKKENHRETHRWCVASNEAIEVCSIIVFYLKEKTQQALLLMLVDQTKLIPKIRRKLSNEAIEERNRFRNLIKECKGRVKIN